MIIRVHAGWVVPVAAPVLRGGWIDVDAARGEIVGVGASGVVSRTEPARTIDMPDATRAG